MLKKMADIIDRMNMAISSWSMWLIIPISVLMVYDAMMRYFFNKPNLWSAELCLMLFGAYMILAGPISILKKVQVGVDLFTGKLSLRTRAIINCFTYIFTFIFFSAMLYTSTVYAIESWEIKEISSSAWGQPIYHLKALIPVAMSLMLLQSMAEFFRNLIIAREIS